MIRFLGAVMAGFFQKVNRLVSLIPSGEVSSYGQIAALLGEPRAARTVGWALRALPPCSPVPWHRIINAQGVIPTSRREDSAVQQRALLEAEGICFDHHNRVDMDTYGWQGPAFDDLDTILRD
jgi:methylated-DNA-protein-cysteine methyltransferase-like protein